MKVRWTPFLGVVLFAVQVGAEEPAALDKQEERLSYGIGAEMGRNFKQNGVSVDVDLLLKGLRDALSGTPLLLSEDDLQATMTGFRQGLIKKQRRDKRLTALENKREGDAFLAENKTKDGVVSLSSGVQYQILKVGEGKKPAETDTVEVSYRGTLINGIEFDSTYRAGKPATFEVKSAIPGLREALKLMPSGSKWRIFVPPELAYLEQGTGRYIGPNATLVFDLELLAIR